MSTNPIETTNKMKKPAPAAKGSGQSKNRKVSGYGKQLAEKQKAKEVYGLRERQFANYVAKAAKKTGDTSKILLAELESRLDNVVFRAGLAATRAAARQMVSHGHILLNGRKLTVPSSVVKAGDEIKVSNRAKGRKGFETMPENLAKLEAPAWLTVNAKDVSAKVLNEPTVDMPAFDAKLIIEFYSR